MKKLTHNWWKVALVVGLSLGVCASAAIAGEGPGGGKKPVAKVSSTTTGAKLSVNVERTRIAADINNESDKVAVPTGTDVEFVTIRANAAKTAPAKAESKAKAPASQPVLLTK
jgi:hypothetical protein